MKQRVGMWKAEVSTDTLQAFRGAFGASGILFRPQFPGRDTQEARLLNSHKILLWVNI